MKTTYQKRICDCICPNCGNKLHLQNNSQCIKKLYEFKVWKECSCGFRSHYLKNIVGGF